jgi:hypothetical protein
MKKHYLLLFMLLCYTIPIYYVYYYYNCNNSISNIICNDDYKNIILFFMGLMGVGTLLYEIERNDIFSIISICILLISIYGLILFNESNKLHYFFATLVFVVILCFMIRHCYLTNCNKILLSSLFLSVILLVIIITNFDNNIFYSEVMYILNFAFYYLFLHFI